MMDNKSFIFRSFASGSSGNCYYLGLPHQGILIDAGISARTIAKHLKDMGLDFSHIMGVLVTHDHADHIRAVGALGEKLHVPIYSTREIHDGIDRNYGLREKLRISQRYFEKGVPWTIMGMTINTFGISHDSSDCVGYVIDFLGQRFMIATDCGEPSAELEQAIATSNHIVIEANHDEQRLLNGPYPTYLKQRILSPTGHQSNMTCAELLAHNYHPGMRNIFLCHLSQENNTPDLAVEAVHDEMIDTAGIITGEDVFLTPLPRTAPSPLFTLNNDPIDPQTVTPVVEKNDEDVADMTADETIEME